MGETITELLNLGLQIKKARRHSQGKKRFHLKSFSMGTPRIPLEDKEALNAALDGRDA
jgi:hypothetical protein